MNKEYIFFISIKNSVRVHKKQKWQWLPVCEFVGGGEVGEWGQGKE